MLFYQNTWQRFIVKYRFLLELKIALLHPYEKGEGGRFGLGLSIVDKVVKANHYRVRGFNTEDGVCFEIYRDVPEKKEHRRRNPRQKKDNYLM